MWTLKFFVNVLSPLSIFAPYLKSIPSTVEWITNSYSIGFSGFGRVLLIFDQTAIWASHFLFFVVPPFTLFAPASSVFIPGPPTSIIAAVACYSENYFGSC